MARKKDTAVPLENVILPEEIPASSEAQPAEAPQTPSSPTQPPEPVRAVVRAGNGLNLRAGPGPGFEVCEILPDGMEVSVLTLRAESGSQVSFDFLVPGWKYIFTGRNAGWVDLRFLELREDGHGGA